MIDFTKIKFVARPNTWFDEGSIANLDSISSHDYPSGYFYGIVGGDIDGEECGLDEFDWIDEGGNCLNSNIPHILQCHVLGNWLIKDHNTEISYDLMNNRIVEK